MVRRTWAAGGLFFTALLCGLLSVGPAQASPEEILSAWPGRYEGFNDGRPSVLLISEKHRSGDRVTLEIELRDEERNTIFRGEAKTKANRKAHILKGFTLRSSDGIKKKVKRLYLLTWDSDFIAGYTKWSGEEYGLAYTRREFAAPVDKDTNLNEDENRFAALCQWVGRWEGHQDGRRAHLEIDLERPTPWTDQRYRIRLEDLERDTEFTGSERIRGFNPIHKMTKMKLRSGSGLEKNVRRLFLHTWNTNIISGHTKWKGRTFGFVFTRTDPDARPACIKSMEAASEARAEDSEPDTEPDPEPSLNTNWWDVGCLCRNQRTGAALEVLFNACIDEDVGIVTATSNVCLLGGIRVSPDVRCAATGERRSVKAGPCEAVQKNILVKETREID